MITRNQAWNKINQLINNKNLLKHCLAVEAAMLAYAKHFGINEAEEEKWAIAGLIHDADWEKYPKEHPQIIIKWLSDNGADEDIINAVASHSFHFQQEAKTLMAKTLRAIDELTGLIVAVALVHPNKKLSALGVDSLLKKWKDKSFAKGVNREEIERGAGEMEIVLDKHIEIVLEAMKKIADQLGL